MGTRNKAVALGAVVAAGVGYAVGILTAPKSGKETRKDISKGASRARIQSERQLKKLHSEITDGEAYSKKTKAKAKKEVDEAVVKAKKAQKKAKELLSALHDGDADDPNLQAVIKEVKLAKKNLVAFLKKK